MLLILLLEILGEHAQPLLETLSCRLYIASTHRGDQVSTVIISLVREGWTLLFVTIFEMLRSLPFASSIRIMRRRIPVDVEILSPESKTDLVRYSIWSEPLQHEKIILLPNMNGTVVFRLRCGCS